MKAERNLLYVYRAIHISTLRMATLVTHSLDKSMYTIKCISIVYFVFYSLNVVTV